MLKYYYGELEKKPLFELKTVFLVYNDVEFLKKKEKVFDRFLNLCKGKTVILVYEELSEKDLFTKYFNDYITIFNNVTTDVAINFIVQQNKNISLKTAKRIAYNASNSYNNIIEELNKYKWLGTSDDCIDALTYATLFTDKEEAPTPKQFADALLTRNAMLLSEYVNLLDLKKENVLAYIPELYNTIFIAIYLKMYGKWEGSTIAYNSGEYWGRVKEVRELNISYSLNDLLDIRILINALDLDVRTGKMKSSNAWDFIIGVIV